MTCEYVFPMMLSPFTFTILSPVDKSPLSGFRLLDTDIQKQQAVHLKWWYNNYQCRARRCEQALPLWPASQRLCPWAPACSAVSLATTKAAVLQVAQITTNQCWKEPSSHKIEPQNFFNHASLKIKHLTHQYSKNAMAISGSDPAFNVTSLRPFGSTILGFILT